MWTLPCVLVKYPLSDFTEAGELHSVWPPWAEGTERSAQLTSASCGHGASVSQLPRWAQLNANSAALIHGVLFWTTGLIYIYIYTHIYMHICVYIYIRFGGGKMSLLTIETASIWQISFNQNMETWHNLPFYKALFMYREPFNWLLLHNIMSPSLPSPLSFSLAHYLLYLDILKDDCMV